MGEMEDVVINGEDKTASSSNPGLQVSVSFGRFENDSLSWEKFSAFSLNKYLEEVEKCATPGSVAQKKAYFEAHYKKIAERKAELMDQENQMEKKASSFRLIVQNQGNSLAECGVDGESSGQCTYEEDKHVTDIATEVNESLMHEHNEETVTVKECQTSVHVVKEECRDVVDSPKLEKPEEVVRLEDIPEEVVVVDEEQEREVKEEVKEEIPSKDETPIQVMEKERDNNLTKTKDANVRMNETPVKEMKKEKDKNLTTKNDGNARISRTTVSPKTNPVNKKPIANKILTNRKTSPSKERSAPMATKKQVSPLPKAQGLSTPRITKPASTFTSMSTSSSSVKKDHVPTLPRNKQTAPKSSHMSLSLGPSGSDPTAFANTRKSLIMERMGDKDIVKRAFKTFQRSFDQSKSSIDGQSLASVKVPTKATSVSALSRTPKENVRYAKTGSVEKKSTGAERSSSFGLKNKTADKQKELSKISRENSGARVVERTRLQAKPKAGVMDAKTLRHSLDPKAKPMQGSL